MRPYVLPLALLFIAFTIPSDAQKSGTAGAQAQAAEAEVVVQEGEALTVECALRPEERAEWRLDGELPPADMRAGADRAGAGAGAGGGLRARLHAAAARAHHAGLYTCRRDPRAAPVRVRVLPAPAAPHTRPASEATATAGAGAGAEAPAGAADAAAAGAGRAVDPYEDYPKALVEYELGSELVFNCTRAEPVSASYKWMKNGTELELVRELAGRHVLEAGGAALRLPHAYENDFGNYTCLAGGEWARGWQAAARLVAKLPADTNVVEGQKLSVTCRLLGKPYARVSWALVGADGNATALPTAGEGARFAARDSPAGVPGGVLELAAAAREDAGNYSCVPPGGHPAFTVVRVKDVYAALWPFLGICLEVFVLCAIILVYEKRRTKPELDDSDADTHDQ